MIFRPVLVCCSNVRICSVSDTLHRQPSTPHPVRSSRRGLSGIECSRCSVSNVRACVSCLAWSALPPALGAGVSTSGVYGASRGLGWSVARIPKPIKRRFSYLPTPLFSAQITPPPIVNLKNPAKKQKDPYKGSVLCAILALQALKGRNLQWLKVK